MGKPTGFIEYLRELPLDRSALERIRDWNEFHFRMEEAKLREQGVWVFAGGLHPADTATVVDANRGDVLITDGPFSEAKEQLGGFWVISASDLDAALKWATEASAACAAPVEVRPFQDEPEG